MGEVIDCRFRDEMQGAAKCLNCEHMWTGKLPVGQTELQCPECLTMKGVFVWPIIPEEGFECANCGNIVWYVGLNGIWCSHCATHYEFDDLVD